MNWRNLSIFALLFVALLAIAAVTPSQGEPVFENDHFRIFKLGRSSYGLRVKSGQSGFMGCNSGFIVTDSGIVLIDTHSSEEALAEVLNAIHQLTGRQVSHVVNTHFHGDHVSGNSAFARRTPIYSHVESLRSFSLPESDHEHGTEPDAEVRAPDHGLSEDLTLFSGSQKVELLAIGEAHSTGDLAVYFPADQVLFTGDLYVNGYVGYLGEGFFKTWIEKLEEVLHEKDVRYVVPGHGDISGETELADFLSYLMDFRNSIFMHFEMHGTIEGYELPERYDHLRARFFLEKNYQRAYNLWQRGEL